MPDSEPTSEEVAGPTPNGGVRSVANYLDAAMKPCPKDHAVHIEILEYDEAGNSIARTWLGKASKRDEAE